MARTRPSSERNPDTLLVVLLSVALLTLVGLPAALAALLLWGWLRRAPAGDRERVAVTLALLVLCGGMIYGFREVYPVIPDDLRRALRSGRGAQVWATVSATWIATFWIFPFLALALHVFAPRRPEAEHAARERQANVRDQRRQRQAAKEAQRAPDQVNGAMVLGRALGGDLHGWQQGRWLTVPAAPLGQHLVAVGASGSGKTETLLRLAALAANVYGWQVLFVDAKGDPDTAARFLAAMQRPGRVNVPVFPTRPYDGWRGDAEALLNRLLQVQTFSEPYYEQTASRVLALALQAPPGVPRSSRELLRRLDRPALLTLYKDHERLYEVERLKGEEVRGVYQRYAGFFDAVGGRLDGSWSAEDVDAAYFQLEGTALRREAASVGRYLLEELAHYATQRKRRERRTLLIIDEFSAISAGADAANLVERVRTFGMAVALASQSAAGLGLDAPRLLGAAGTLLLHSCPDPELLTRRAGTVERLTPSMQVERGQPTGRLTLRPEQQARIDPNAVRQLQVGEAFVIAGGRAARVQVAPLQVEGDGARVGALLAEGGWMLYQDALAHPERFPGLRVRTAPETAAWQLPQAQGQSGPPGDRAAPTGDDEGAVAGPEPEPEPEPPDDAEEPAADAGADTTAGPDGSAEGSGSRRSRPGF